MKTKSKRLRRTTLRATPTLRFSPDAWAKLLFFRNRDDVEIGGFGVTDTARPLLIRDFVTVRQANTVVTVAFDDEAIAAFFDDQVAIGRQPHEFARHWIHTHPGDSPEPSSIDEETFDRVFAGPDWAVMTIVARGGQTYSRVRYNVGPGGAIEMRTAIDYTAPFVSSDHESWAAEYDANVHKIKPARPKRKRGPTSPPVERNAFDDLENDGEDSDSWDFDDLFDDPHDFDFLESEVIRKW